MAALRHHSTPNPNSLKFTWDRGPFVESGFISCTTPEEASLHPLALALLAIEGVSNVFIMPAFATITKIPSVARDSLLPQLESAFTNAS